MFNKATHYCLSMYIHYHMTGTRPASVSKEEAGMTEKSNMVLIRIPASKCHIFAVLQNSITQHNTHPRHKSLILNKKEEKITSYS